MFKCECGRQFHTDEPDTDDASTCECGKVAREARSQNETRNTIAKERDWQETRAARIRALIDNNPMRHAERIPEAEYHEGWAHGLSWALEQLNAEARV